jgi:hypothetical protein
MCAAGGRLSAATSGLLASLFVSVVAPMATRMSAALLAATQAVVSSAAFRHNHGVQTPGHETVIPSIVSEKCI